jgi:hypothetical protein
VLRSLIPSPHDPAAVRARRDPTWPWGHLQCTHPLPFLLLPPFYAAKFDAMNALLAFLTENCCAADCGSTCATAIDGRQDKAAWQALTPASKVGKTKALGPSVFGAVPGWSAGSRDEGAFA